MVTSQALQMRTSSRKASVSSSSTLNCYKMESALSLPCTAARLPNGTTHPFVDPSDVGSFCICRSQCDSRLQNYQSCFGVIILNK